VPFRLADATGEVDIDARDLDAGLVVIPRESIGVAGDVEDRLPRGTPSHRRARVRVDQLSSIEHAIALGVPELRDERIFLRPGQGRPLVLTTLEPPEAMRVLADGRQARIRVAVALFLVGAVAIAAAVVAAVVGLGR
jgi:hypothetical protein